MLGRVRGRADPVALGIFVGFFIGLAGGAALAVIA